MNYISKNINKYLCFLIMFITLTTVAQDANFNLKKYWYLRWRLKNYFMVEGEGYGKTLPIGIRNIETNLLFIPFFALTNYPITLLTCLNKS